MQTELFPRMHRTDNQVGLFAKKEGGSGGSLKNGLAKCVRAAGCDLLAKKLRG